MDSNQLRRTAEGLRAVVGVLRDHVDPDEYRQRADQLGAQAKAAAVLADHRRQGEES